MGATLNTGNPLSLAYLRAVPHCGQLTTLMCFSLTLALNRQSQSVQLNFSGFILGILSPPIFLLLILLSMNLGDLLPVAHTIFRIYM